MMNKISAVFGSHVFSDQVMRETSKSSLQVTQGDY